VDTFPEGGLERLNLLRKQLEGIVAEKNAIRREIEQRRLRRKDLQMQADPEEQARRAQVIESLRNLVPQMDAARRVYESSIEQRRAIEQERATIEKALESLRPPSQGAFY